MKLRKLIFAALISVLGLGIFFFNSQKVHGETVDTSWTVNEGAIDLSISNVKEGGVGRVSYFTVPIDENNNPDAVNNNSIFIPVANYDVNSDRISIKYKTNIDVSGHNIVLYARCDEYLSETGDIIDAEDKLIGWFNNWNVTKGKAVDGEAFITINHKNYTETRDVKGIVMHFAYDDADTTNEKWMELLGITYHNSETTPTFVSDPVDPSLEEPSALSGTFTNTNSEYSLDIEGSNTITIPVNHWNKALKDMISFDLKTFNGLKVDVKVNSNKVFSKEYSKEEIDNIEISLSDNEVTSIVLELTGTGKISLKNMMVTTIPQVTNYTTSNSDYFSTFEEINEGSYSLHMVRNENAGFAKVIASVKNYRDNYDVLCVDIMNSTNKALIGMTFNDANTSYLISHWEPSSFLEIGEHQLTFYYLKDICPEWRRDSFAMYVNPSSQETSGYNYQGDIKIGIYFTKSKDLLLPEVSFQEDDFEIPYDGKKHSLTPIISPDNLTYDIEYLLGEKTSSSGMTNSGEYKVKITVNGNRKYKSFTKIVDFTITKSTLLTPVLEDFEFDYANALIGFDEDIVVSTSSSFEAINEVMSGSVIKPGDVYYAKRPESSNGIESGVLTINIPSRPNKLENVLTSPSDDKIIIAPITNGEYQIGTGGNFGSWQTSNSFSNLEKATTYTIRVRVKATSTSFESETTEVEVKTTGVKETVAPTVAPTTTSKKEEVKPTTTANEDEPKKGCASNTSYMGLIVILIVVTISIIFVKKSKIQKI